MWTDKAFADCVRRITNKTRGSDQKDLLVDLGVFCYIVSEARYDGDRKGWTQLPVRHLAEDLSHMGSRRVLASLDRLEDLGVIEGDEENERAAVVRKARWYRPREFSPLPRKNPNETLKAGTLLKTPKEKSSIPVEDVVMWDPLGKRVVWKTFPATDTQEMPSCLLCNFKFHATMGAVTSSSGECVACSLYHATEPDQESYSTSILGVQVDLNKAWINNFRAEYRKVVGNGASEGSGKL